MPNPLTSETLAALLNSFSSDEEEAAFAYTKLRGSLVRYFQLKGISEADEAADATIDRVAEKLNQKTEIEDLTKYAFGVAKKVFLERLRASQIESRATARFYEKSAKNDGVVETNYLEPLRKCFDALYDDERKLLLRYFEDLPSDQLFEHRQELAKRQNVSLNVLRNRVSRIRKCLEDCIDKKK